MSRPISMCPMQWLTPRSGFPHSWATVRATRATVTKGAPIPGPEKTRNKPLQWGDSNIFLCWCRTRWACCVSQGGTIQHVKQTDMCWTSDESLFTISFLLTNYLHNKRLDFTVPRGEPGPCVTFRVGNTVNVSRFQPCLIQRLLEDSQNDSAVMPGCVTGQEPLKWHCVW